MRNPRGVLGWCLWVGFAAACGSGHGQTQGHAPGPASKHGRPTEHDSLAAVRAVHGGAGPWVVAGYRMGEHALKTLGLPRGSFDLDVTHASPSEVQYSCIADGAAASTGASLGKLNLHWREASRDELRTTYRNRVTGQQIALTVTRAFAERYADVPRPQLAAAGEEVLGLADSQIFERVGAAR